MGAKIGPACVLIAACGGSQPVHKGVVWTDNEEPPSASQRREQKAHRHAPSSTQEPYVPHLRCNDGDTAPDCSPNSMRGDCCVNQGGVYRDAWGNVVFE